MNAQHNYQCFLSRSFTSTGEGSPWNLSIKVNFRREWERANSLFLLGFEWDLSTIKKKDV